ncbi:MAG: hypothetical protein HON32_05965 [Francisellaceae bacterium]|nr:hypothetical protein [Francisellaceae bacterium]
MKLMIKHFLRISSRHFLTIENKVLFFVSLIIFSLVVGFKLLHNQVLDALMTTKSEILGANLVLESALPIDIGNVLNENVLFSNKISYKTVIIKNDKVVLVDVIAVDANFPLSGHIKLDDNSKASGAMLEDNSIWLDVRAMQAIGVTINDSIKVNNKEYLVAKQIVSLPQSISLSAISPKLIIKSSEVVKILQQPGIRAKYEMLLNGNTDVIDNIVASTKTNSMLTYKRANDTASLSNKMINKLDILLTICFVILLSICICLWIYCLRYFQLASIKSSQTYHDLGVSKNKIVSYYLFSGGASILLALIVGVLAGGIIDNIVARYILQNTISFIWPWLDIAIVVMFIYFLYVKTIMTMLNIEAKKTIFKLLAMGLISVAFYYYLRAQVDLIYIALATLCMFIIVYECMNLCYSKLYFVVRKSSWHIKYAALQLQRYSKDYALFSSILMLILALCIGLIYTNKSILHDWGTRFSADLPNYFFIDIPQDNKKIFEDIWNVDVELYPAVSARLTKINNDVLIHPSVNMPGRKGFHRDLKVSGFNELKFDNKIISGEWLNDDSENQVSVEEGFAKRLDIELQDSLTVQVGSESIEAKVTSVRSVDWQNMSPNFFLIFSKDIISALPYTYMTSIHLGYAQAMKLNTLVQQLPMVSIFDSDMIIKSMWKLVEQFSLIVYVFTAILIILLCIAMALILACQFKSHQYEWKLLCDIGIKYQQLRDYLRFEYSLIGILTGMISIIFASILSTYLLTNIFKIGVNSYNFVLSGYICLTVLFVSIVVGSIVSKYIMQKGNYR